MSDKLKSWLEEQGNVLVEMRQIDDTAEAESRDLNDTEKASYEKLDTRWDELNIKITREESSIERERKMIERTAAQDEARSREELPGGNEPAPGKPENREQEQRDEKREMFNRCLSLTNTADELRVLQADSDIAGGYLVTPEDFRAELIQAVDNASVIRSLARVIPLTKAASIGFPELETDMEDTTWQGEITSINEDTAMNFGKRELFPHEHAKLLKVSEKLIRNSAIPVSSLVSERMGYKLGITEEQAYIDGSGAQRPLGLFTASNQGIDTGQDVSTGNTTSAVTFDGLKEAFYNLKQQYQAKASWLFNRTGVKNISKLKNGEGDYIWEAFVRSGVPRTIEGAPVLQSEYVPDTWTTSLYVGIVGDFSKYWIIETGNLAMKVLNELYARTGQIGYIGRREVDAAPVLAEAFTRVKLG